MATYIELLDIYNDSTFRQKIAVACVISADTIRTEAAGTANHTTRVAWAKKVYASPTNVANEMIWAVLAQNKAVVKASILAASDASIQTAVDDAIAAFL
jgi:hypothetical protein